MNPFEPESAMTIRANDSFACNTGAVMP
jgi:hypothetical protein